ncbi:Protein SOSEKI 1 [Dispira simplex]|nr:Protein SOSEKI 1 [Dispira simplex]
MSRAIHNNEGQSALSNSVSDLGKLPPTTLSPYHRPSGSVTSSSSTSSTSGSQGKPGVVTSSDPGSPSGVNLSPAVTDDHHRHRRPSIGHTKAETRFSTVTASRSASGTEKTSCIPSLGDSIESDDQSSSSSMSGVLAAPNCDSTGPRSSPPPQGLISTTADPMFQSANTCVAYSSSSLPTSPLPLALSLPSCLTTSDDITPSGPPSPGTASAHGGRLAPSTMSLNRGCRISQYRVDKRSHQLRVRQFPGYRSLILLLSETPNSHGRLSRNSNLVRPSSVCYLLFPRRSFSCMYQMRRSTLAKLVARSGQVRQKISQEALLRKTIHTQPEVSSEFYASTAFPSRRVLRRDVQKRGDASTQAVMEPLVSASAATPLCGVTTDRALSLTRSTSQGGNLFGDISSYGIHFPGPTISFPYGACESKLLAFSLSYTSASLSSSTLPARSSSRLSCTVGSYHTDRSHTSPSDPNQPMSIIRKRTHSALLVTDDDVFGVLPKVARVCRMRLRSKPAFTDNPDLCCRSRLTHSVGASRNQLLGSKRSIASPKDKADSKRKIMSPEGPSRTLRPAVATSCHCRSRSHPFHTQQKAHHHIEASATVRVTDKSTASSPVDSTLTVIRGVPFESTLSSSEQTTLQPALPQPNKNNGPRDNEAQPLLHNTAAKCPAIQKRQSKKVGTSSTLRRSGATDALFSRPTRSMATTTGGGRSHMRHPLSSSSPLLPPINRFTLRELGLSQMVNNIQLRHDIVLESNLEFRPNNFGEIGRQKEQEAINYWSSVDQEMRQLKSLLIRKSTGTAELSPSGGSTKHAALSLSVSRIALMIGEIREVMTEMLAAHDQDLRRELASNLDVKLIHQQLQHGVFDVANMVQYVTSVLKRHCAPVRDSLIDSILRAVNRGEYARALKRCFELLEVMRLDLANHQIRTMRPQLVSSAAQFEWTYVNTMLQGGTLGTTKAKTWWHSLNNADSDDGTASSSSPSLTTECPNQHTLFLEGFVKLVATENRRWTERLPETFHLDYSRLNQFRNEWHNVYVMAIILLMYRQAVTMFLQVRKSPAGSNKSIAAGGGESTARLPGSTLCDHIVAVKNELWSLLSPLLDSSVSTGSLSTSSSQGSDGSTQSVSNSDQSVSSKGAVSKVTATSDPRATATFQEFLDNKTPLSKRTVTHSNNSGSNRGGGALPPVTFDHLVELLVQQAGIFCNRTITAVERQTLRNLLKHALAVDSRIFTLMQGRVTQAISKALVYTATTKDFPISTPVAGNNGKGHTTTTTALCSTESAFGEYSQFLQQQGILVLVDELLSLTHKMSKVAAHHWKVYYRLYTMFSDDKATLSSLC